MRGLLDQLWKKTAGAFAKSGVRHTVFELHRLFRCNSRLILPVQRSILSGPSQILDSVAQSGDVQQRYARGELTFLVHGALVSFWNLAEANIELSTSKGDSKSSMPFF